MKRRDFISAAAVLTATTCSGAALLNAEEKPKDEKDSSNTLNKSFGFFDVDSLELSNGAKGAYVFPQLSIRERTVPLTQSLNALHELARNGHHPFVFTTCCSGRMPKMRDLADVLYIPSEGGTEIWQGKINSQCMYYLEKNRTTTSCYDMFSNNSNASVFFKEIGVDRWVLFGNGAELCILNDAVNLLTNGCKVIVLSDVLAYSAKGYGLSGTPAGRTEMLKKIQSLNGEVMSLGEFFQEYNYVTTGSKWDPDLQKTVYK